MTASKTRIDRLGERLAAAAPSEADLRLLDEYRRSFGAAYQHVHDRLRDRGFQPTGRPAKSTSSIVEKLRRESLRLSQMQDIAGCRILVGDLSAQSDVVDLLLKDFPDATVVDRRSEPSNGYRAVHVIVRSHGLPLEIQVRTTLQHLWAELSERASDIVHPDLKYGGGPESWRARLDGASVNVSLYELLDQTEAHLAVLAAEQPGIRGDDLQREHLATRTRLAEALERLATAVNALIHELNTLGGGSR